MPHCRTLLPLVCLASALFVPTQILGQTNVLTQRNDLSRTGLNNSETVLTPSNVNANSFGKLFTAAVDGHVYAQPLFVSALSVNGAAAQDVVIVATEHNSVYALTASTGSILWQTSLIIGSAGATTTTVPSGDVYTGGVTDVGPEIGITGTPAIDGASHTLYVVAATKEVSAAGSAYYQRLHKIDITTGADLGSVAITGSVTGNGTDAVNGTVAFNPKSQLQRTGLALVNGNVYMGFGSHNDVPVYHGWVFGYDATLTRTGLFCTTPDGEQGGIWEGGGGLSVDASGSLFVSTGNGYNDLTSPSPRNFGESIVKLSTPALTPVDFFSPYDQTTLSNNDADLGVNSPLILPTQPGSFPNELILQSKAPTLYLLNRDSLGGYNTTQNHDVQNFSANNGFATGFGLLGNTVYFGSPNGTLQAYVLSNGRFATAASSASSNTFHFPAPSPSITANGGTNGIVWAVDYQGFSDGSGYTSGLPAVLYAYDATALSRTLYSSEQAGNARDQGPQAVKFTVPTVANGRVYLAGQNAVVAYGLLPTATQGAVATPVISPGSRNYGHPQNVTITTATAGATIYYTLDGTTPTTNSAVYTSPILITSRTFLQAIAVKTDYQNSAVASASYTIKGH